MLLIITCSSLPPPGFGPPPGVLNGGGPLGYAGEDLMESMLEEASSTSGGPAPFTFGPLAPPHGTDQREDGWAPAPPREQEIITVGAMQTPCRCTNSYAYL